MGVSGGRHAPRTDEKRVRGGHRPAKRTLDAVGPAIRWRMAEAGVGSASAMQWLAQYEFDSLEEIQDYATKWMWTYNHDRPNMALGGITPRQRLAMAA